MTDQEKLVNFERAFRDGTGGCRRTCHCGKTFFDDSRCYSWEPGELEELRENAISIDGGPSDVSFEGKSFVLECDCWHARAGQLIEFFDDHGFAIAEYLSLEKARKLREAHTAPIVL